MRELEQRRHIPISLPDASDKVAPSVELRSVVQEFNPRTDILRSDWKHMADLFLGEIVKINTANTLDYSSQTAFIPLLITMLAPADIAALITTKYVQETLQRASQQLRAEKAYAPIESALIHTYKLLFSDQVEQYLIDEDGFTHMNTASPKKNDNNNPLITFLYPNLFTKLLFPEKSMQEMGVTDDTLAHTEVLVAEIVPNSLSGASRNFAHGSAALRIVHPEWFNKQVFPSEILGKIKELLQEERQFDSRTFAQTAWSLAILAAETVTIGADGKMLVSFQQPQAIKQNILPTIRNF